jgi:DNA-binding NarL/FixJ family response regulator
MNNIEKMQDIYIASKNTILSNYLFLFLKEVGIKRSYRLATEYTSKIDLVILDTETISPEETKQYAKGIPIILFTYNVKPFLINYTSQYDINGIISLSMEPENLMKTVETALENDIYYDETMISMLFSNTVNNMADKVASLTSRENEILKLMMKDFTNEEIAEHFELSVRTVNAHKGNIMRKVGVKTTAGLIQIMLDYSPAFRSPL